MADRLPLVLLDDCSLAELPSGDVLLGTGRKAGCVPRASFAGNPKRFTVTFATAFPDANWAPGGGPVTTNTTTYPWTFEDKTAAGFVILVDKNNIDDLTEFCWTATPNGET